MREVGGPSGTSLTDLCVALAKAHGVLVHHQRPARTDQGYRSAIQGDPGFPDLVLVGVGLEMWELKSEIGDLTERQDTWRLHLRDAGITHRVVRPSDHLLGHTLHWIQALAPPR